MDKLRGLKDQHPPIGDVRGIGLMIGVKFAHPHNKKATSHIPRLMYR